MGEVVPVPLRTGSGSCSPVPNCGTISADTQERPASVGQDLHTARHRRGVTLSDISSALKISPDYLTAIEIGRFEDLPARVYAVGYVRSYAAHLGLDAASFAARFKTEMAAAGISEPAFNPLPQSGELPCEEGSRASPYTKPFLIRLPSWPENGLSQTAGALILAGAALYSAYHVLASVPRLAVPDASVPAQLEAETGLAGEPAGQPAASEIPPGLHRSEAPSLHEIPLRLPVIDLQFATAELPKPKFAEPASPTSTQVASSQLEQAPRSAHKAQPPSVSAETPVIEFHEVGAIQRVSARNGVQLNARSALSLGQHFGIANTNSRIILRVHGPTEIRVRDNRNMLLFDRALDAGDTYRVPDIIGLKLSAADAGAVEIILDDTTVGFAGKHGIPAQQISLDPKTIAHLSQGG